MSNEIASFEATIGQHKYTCQAFEHDEGVDLLLELAELVFDGLGQVAGAGAGVDLNAILDLDLTALSQLNWQRIGGAVSTIPRKLMQKGSANVLSRLLKRTKAFYSQSAEHQGKWVALDNKDLRNAVWRNAYMESFKVIGWVLKENFTPFLMEVLPLLPGQSQKPANGPTG